MPDPTPAEPLVIKRYPNRKLYDTAAKRYITLDQIEDRVREGRDVRVFDHETGEDITTVTLSNILLGNEKKHGSFVPRSVFTDIIQKGSRTIVDYARKVVGGWFGGTEGALGAGLEEMLERMVQAGQLGREQVVELRKAIAEQVMVNWERIEAVISARVQATLAHLELPNSADLRKMNRLVEHLEGKLAEIEAGQDPGAAKPARRGRGRAGRAGAAGGGRRKGQRGARRAREPAAEAGGAAGDRAGGGGGAGSGETAGPAAPPATGAPPELPTGGLTT